MTQEQFDREAKYRAAIFIAKKMLASGIISDADFVKIKVFFITKFKPIFADIC